MASAESQERLHSAEYFGEFRDYWWNPDYLALIAARLGLNSARRVLDVGSGVGHWGRTLLPHLHASAEVVGVDREPQWVRLASQAAASRGLGGRLSYTVGDAHGLPFGDGSFDLVTCQTVLLHLADVPRALREMVRVLAPGGRLLVAEPNNRAGALIRVRGGTPQETDDQLRLARLQAICELGKERLGEGDNSIGERLPRFFAELGLNDLQVFQSDHAYPMTPPYATPAQRALKEQLLEWAERGFWVWDERDTRRYFLAAGGDEREFAALWELAVASVRAEADELRRGVHYSAGGSVVYLVSAVSPT
jgi:SAM-dependent methyltransferase